GQTLGHYDIGPVIGRGSSCIVFHATDTKDNRPVAFKVLLPEFSRDEEEMQRFVRAMKTVMPLRHPNLIALYAAGKTGGYCWSATSSTCRRSGRAACRRRSTPARTCTASARRYTPCWRVGRPSTGAPWPRR